MKLVTKPTYQNIVMAADGIPGATHIGAIMYMYVSNPSFYNDANTFIGASIGSIWCSLISMGVTLDTFLSVAYEFLLKDSYDCVDTLCCKRLLRNFGMAQPTYTHLNNFLEYVFKCTKPTFGMHYAKFKKTLVISGYNMTDMKVEYFDHINYPNMPLIQAINISTAIPFFFEPVTFNGCVYVDPVISEKVPIKYVVDMQIGSPKDTLTAAAQTFKTFQKSVGDQEHKTLIIKNTCEATGHQFTPVTKHTLQFNSIGSYFKNIMHSATNVSSIENINPYVQSLTQMRHGCDVVHIYVPDPYDRMYGMMTADIDMLVINGYETMKRFANQSV